MGAQLDLLNNPESDLDDALAHMCRCSPYDTDEFFAAGQAVTAAAVRYLDWLKTQPPAGGEGG